jgi:hypothetical protein
VPRPRVERLMNGRSPIGWVSGACRLVLLAAALPALALATSPQVTWSEPVEIASGDAFQGAWRMNESDFRYVDDPTVALTRDGALGVAWVDQAQKDVLFQSYGPDGQPRLARPVNVSRSPRIFSWLPRMVISPRNANHVFVLWQEIVFSGGSHGGEIYFARSTDGGATFTDPVNLSNTPAGAGKGRLTRHLWHNGSLDLALTPEGHLYAAWTEYEGALRVSRSTDGGGRFSRPVLVAGNDPTPARGPSLAVDATGTVHLAWTIGEDRAADIHYTRSTDRGRTFEEPRRILRSGGHADAPKLAADSRGVVHLVYAESPAGPFQRYHIRHSRSRDSGRTFDTPQEISGGRLERFESAHFPALSIDGADNLVVLWELFPRREHRPQGLGFAASGDGGKTFAPPGVVPGTAGRALGFNGSRQGLLMRKLAVNDAGALATVNSTFRPGASSHVWLIRGRVAER